MDQFIFLLLLICFTPADGQSTVIGSPQPIIAAPGDDVILPCHVEPPLDVVGLTVEWSRPDLRPDPSDPLSRVDYVHLYRDRSEVTDMKLSSYDRRTALFNDELRHGNISLKISNVTLADEGRFRCLIPKLKSRMKSSIVHLVVAKTWTTPTQPESQTSDPETDVKGVFSRWTGLVPAVVFCVILVFGVTGYLIWKFQKQEVSLTYKGPYCGCLGTEVNGESEDVAHRWQRHFFHLDLSSYFKASKQESMQLQGGST